MKCYRHQDRDAVAVCKHCAKGVCVACLVDGEWGASCSEACAKEVAWAYATLRRARATAAMARASFGWLGPFLLAVGAAMLVASFVWSSKASGFQRSMAAVFLAAGCALWVVMLRRSRSPE